MEIISNEILKQCQHGDKTAFRVVVQTYQRMVFALAVRLLCDEEEAKDIVQETFIKVWVNITRYDLSQNFRTWIYTIATRQCLDRLRQKAPIEPMPEDEAYFEDYASDLESDRPLENRELISIIKTLVQQLSPKQRTVFTLIRLENLSTDEVTEITGMDADKIKCNLYVARKTVREQLKKLGYE